MATQSEIAQDLFKTCDKACLHIKDVQRFTGFGSTKVKQLLAPLPSLGDKRGKTWYYKDVAQAIFTDGRRVEDEPKRKYKRA